MKLSEAIRLGSVMGEPVTQGKLHGCALGMGMRALGISPLFRFAFSWQGETHHAEIEHYARLRAIWPWLGIERDLGGKLVCGCFVTGRKHQSFHAITHLFDDHVCNGSLTLDQLIAFIASIEPAEAPTQDSQFEETHEAVPDSEAVVVEGERK
jgi:hypothetical protein